MTARISGWVSRKAAGLRAPRSRSRNITPRGGVGIHYGGPAQTAALDGADHSLCVKTWRGWQRYHMVVHGWVDIAYTGGVCNHGYAFAGRGIGVRTAANGTNNGNQYYYAIVWIGGAGQKPSDEALDAFDWWIERLRKSGAGKSVKPHKWFKLTACPGDALVSYARSRDGKSFSTPRTGVGVVRRIQRLLEVKADGFWGPQTDAVALLMRKAARAKVGFPRVRRRFPIKPVQAIIDTDVDGIWGPKSQGALKRWVKDLQAEVGATQDGIWGWRTNRKFLNIRKKFLNNY